MPRRPPRAALSLVLLLCALTASPRPSRAAALTPQHRLGHDVVPTAETLRLELDCDRKDYAGSARIQLAVRRATRDFRLHAKELKLERVTLTGPRGRIPVEWTVENPEFGVLAVTAGAPLAPGAYTLDLGFSNDFDVKANGLYRLETGGHAYAFSQFESIAAREAFPCWDEPEFKIPWQVTLVVPKAHLAIANTPVASESTTAGARVVVFKRTPALPSYLLAFATGPLETVPIPGMSIPGRVVTVQGGGALAGQAVKYTPPLLAALEKYFGRPYPFEKLDLLAVPEYWAGAMENPGAITFRSEILLLDPRVPTPVQTRRLVTITAHELAHMWFGDLVTMKWWNDVWLNESFASWMGDKISDQVAPELAVSVREVEGTQRALVTDARLSTRAIRQPVDAFSDLEALFDELAYQKGQAVLGMFESWVGPETFRRGVMGYLKAHEWGNAEAGDLWSALSKAAGEDLGAAVPTFTDQAGAPAVTVEPLVGGRVRLSQRRFLNAGLRAPGRARWIVPVVLQFSDGHALHTQRVWLRDSVQIVTLDPPVAPEWIHPNVGATGYYRWEVPPAMLLELCERAPRTLTPRERVGLLGNLAALLDGGSLRGEDYLAALSRFGSDSSPEVVEALATGLEKVRQSFVSPELEPAFARYVRGALHPALDRFGAAPAAGEPPPVSGARATVLEWLGDAGRDSSARALGRRLARDYLRDPESVAPSLADVGLQLAALDGDAALFAQFRTRFEKATIPVERVRFLSALSWFRDTALVGRALAYSVEGPLRPQEISTLLRGLARDPDLKDRVLAFVMRRDAEIRSRIPVWAASRLASYGEGCSLARLDEAERFYKAPERRVPGIDEELGRVSSRVHDCVTLNEREGPSVAAYLRRLAQAP